MVEYRARQDKTGAMSRLPKKTWSTGWYEEDELKREADRRNQGGRR